MDLNVTPMWQEALQMSGLRQPQLSELTGLSVSAINRAVNGLQNLSLPDFRILERTIHACKEIQARNPAPIDWRNIRAVKILLAAYAEESANPPEPPTSADFDLLARVRVSDDFKRIAEDLACSLIELLGRVETANRRFTFQSNRLAKWSQDIRALTNIMNGEIEARRSR